MNFQIVFIFSFVLIFSACQKSDSNGVNVPILPLAQSTDFVSEGCLNIQLLQQLLTENPRVFPARQVTTDFKIKSEVSQKKNFYYTHRAFDLNDMNTQQINLLLNPVQVGCSEVTSQTASNETLVFKVVKADQKTLSLRLQKEKEKKNKPLQVYEIELKVMGSQHLQVISRYKSLDFHCRGSQVITFEIHQDYYWATQSSDLPVEFNLNEAFLANYLSTVDLSTEEQILPNTLTADMMLNLKMKPVKDEVLLCP